MLEEKHAGVINMPVKGGGGVDAGGDEESVTNRTTPSDTLVTLRNLLFTVLRIWHLTTSALATSVRRSRRAPDEGAVSPHLPWVASLKLKF